MVGALLLLAAWGEVMGVVETVRLNGCMSKTVGVVTCMDMPEPDVDQDLMLEGFEKGGVEVEMVAWDDKAVNWERFSVVVLRSCWDYPERVAEFRLWLEWVSELTRVWNSRKVVEWNLDKHYLRDLCERGVGIVPTEFVDGGVGSGSWKGKVVVKPCVGAGSMGVRVFDHDPDGVAEYLRSCGDEGMMVQPFMDSVDRGGERSLIWIDGEFTHKIVKRPRFDGEDESVEVGGEITEEELTVGKGALAAAGFENLLYGRVDVMEGPGGECWVSELELIEPSLFFLQNPVALERYVAAVRQLIQ